MTGISGVLSLLGILLIFAGVLVLTYWATKYMSRRFAAGGGTGSRYIQVIDRMPLGQNQQLLLVRVAGKTMLIGAAGQGFSKLCDIEEELPEAPAEAGPTPFSQLLGGLLNKEKKDGQSQDER